MLIGRQDERQNKLTRSTALVCVLLLAFVAGMQVFHLCGELESSSQTEGTLSSVATAQTHCLLCHVPPSGHAPVLLIAGAFRAHGIAEVVFSRMKLAERLLPFQLFVRPPPVA